MNNEIRTVLLKIVSELTFDFPFLWYIKSGASF